VFIHTFALIYILLVHCVMFSTHVIKYPFKHKRDDLMFVTIILFMIFLRWTKYHIILSTLILMPMGANHVKRKV